VFIYNADTYCDSCGERIREDLEARGESPADDSDSYPQGPYPSEPTDSPDHCASVAECLEAIDLAGYGLRPTDPIYGAEARRIGALLSDGLTDEGVRWLVEVLAEADETSTPYQRALYDLWSQEFGDDIYNAARAAAEADGRESGKAAGTWAVDGNTPADSARAFLRGLEDGDPAVLDALPDSPLAGQWGDDPTSAEILAGFGFGFLADWKDPSTADEILDLWSQEWSAGYVESAEADALRAGYLRSVTRGEWRIRTYYAGFDSFSGKTRLGYEFGRVGESPLFAGEDFYCSPLHAEDSDESVRSLLGFLTLRRGDTDAEYFADYSDAQVRFSEESAESVALEFGLYDDDPSPLGDDWRSTDES
jgi:hypothetical protein